MALGVATECGPASLQRRDGDGVTVLVTDPDEVVTVWRRVHAGGDETVRADRVGDLLPHFRLAIRRYRGVVTEYHGPVPAGPVDGALANEFR